MARPLDGPRAAPATGGPARQLVVLAHGYGSNGSDLIGLAPFLAQALPEAAFVSPNAPEPVPGYGGNAFQWFGLSSLEPHRVAAGVEAAAPLLNAFIDAELERLGLPPSACALGGFSQGCMMALHVGLRRPESLGAVVGLSGLLAAPERLRAEIRSRPPILLAHGTHDEVLPASSLFAALGALGAAEVPALWRLSPGQGHTVPQDVLALAAEFLHDAFQGGFAGWSGPQRRPA